MELLGNLGQKKSPQGSPLNKSPVLTIKRGGRNNTAQWQDFIDREQSSVDHLLRDSFATFCRDIKDNLSHNNAKNNTSQTLGGFSQRRRRTSVQSTSSSSSDSPSSRKNSGEMNSHISTMPRLSPVKRTLFKDSADVDGLHLPPGIEELETLYAPMKNLSRPLPSATKYSGQSMPAPHPIGTHWTNWNELNIKKGGMREEDQESEICSVIADIPPPLPPVQSHAVLEKSLGHEIPPIPRTPARQHKFSVPPLPPRTSSKLSMRPCQLSVNHNNAVYANSKSVLHRTSLMSTGSSEGSSGSSGPELPATPVTPTSEQEASAVFSWPNYTVYSPSPSPSDEHRSVSQIGEPPDSSASDSSGPTNKSSVYVKMNKVVFPEDTRESHYMNVLYNAVQRQGGGGSVEDAISPYINMTGVSPKAANNLRTLPNANVDSISTIYASPQSITSSEQSSVRLSKKKLTSTSSSESTSSSSSARAKKKAMAEFKDLMQEVARKRLFRVGLNLFNTRPELGLEYLGQKGFLELSPGCVAKFLFENRGLSNEKIGEYLGNLQSPFAMKVLTCFMQMFNFSNQRVDKSLRKMLQHFRVPGEAQKIEKIMEVFGKRYTKCNPGVVSKLKSPDSIVTLSFAIMLLNTDLHTPNIKAERKMSVQDFTNNLRGVDGGKDFDAKLLKQIYKGIKKQEFVGGADHVTQNQLLQQSIQQDSSSAKVVVSLVEPHRRLVCLCRLYEVLNINARKEPSAGSHQRDLFLFNDLLVVTKQSPKSTKQNPMYLHRDSVPLKGLEVTLFHTPVYHYGIQVSRKCDGDVLVTLNAGSEHDRYKFVMDLQESIFEMNQMEAAAKEMSSRCNTL